MTQSGIDADKHYSVLFGGNKDSIRIRIACGSGADVSVSQVMGAFVRELEEETVNTTGGGSLLIDCTRHGKYLGFLELLPTGVGSESGGGQVSMPLMLVPLRDVEYVLPLEQGRHLSQSP